MYSWYEASARATKGETCADQMTDSFQAHKDVMQFLSQARAMRSALVKRLYVQCLWVYCLHDQRSKFGLSASVRFDNPTPSSDLVSSKHRFPGAQAPPHRHGRISIVSKVGESDLCLVVIYCPDVAEFPAMMSASRDTSIESRRH